MQHQKMALQYPKPLFLLTIFNVFIICLIDLQAQEAIEVEGRYDDPSLATQRAFVEEILFIAGYVPEQIQVYQTLPNYAHVYRVTLDSVNGGFLFVRWDKNKKEHFIANKMIDPGYYYNLKAAREILRKQTQKASFGVADTALQAPDQEQIGKADLEELRQAYDEKEEEKNEDLRALEEKDVQREQRKIERKASKKKN